jgi:hypothetical protein
MDMSPDFLDAYDIPVLAGRGFDRNIANDSPTEGVETQNIIGLFNQEKPWMFLYRPESMRIGSIRISGGNIMDTVEQIEDIWDRVIPEYPSSNTGVPDAGSIPR